MKCPMCSNGFDWPQLTQCGWGTNLKCPDCGKFFNTRGERIDKPVTTEELEDRLQDLFDEEIKEYWMYPGGI